MDIKAYRYVTVLAKTKNYSKAAKELYITPQGLSASIKRMESALGVPLFDSSTGHAALTEYGSIVYQRARTILHEHDAMQEEVRVLFRRKSGRILLSSSTGIFNVIPREAIDRFNRESRTGAHVDISRTQVDYDCETSLLEKKCDFALLNDPIDHSIFSSIPLQSDMMFLWVPADSPYASKDFIKLSDLDGETIICVTPQEFRTSKKNERFFEERAPKCRLVYEDEMISVMEASLQNKGLALIPRTHAESFKGEGRVGIPVKDLTWSFSIAYRTDRILSAQDEEFLGFIRRYEKFHC